MVQKSKRKPKAKTMIFGRQPIIEALYAGQELDKLLVKHGAQGSSINQILGLARDKNIPIQKVPSEKLNWLTDKNHQGVIGFLSLVQYQKMDDVLVKAYDRGAMVLFLLIDGVTDVRNLGAIMRSALCFGVDAIVLPNKGVAQINEETLKASAGALSRINICRVNHLSEAVDFCQENGIQLIATDLNASTPLEQIEMNLPTALVMGSEDTGVSGSILKAANHTVRIPMASDFDSLNVSVASGVLLYEVFRQRNAAE